MATSSTEQVVLEDHPLADRPLPVFVDWLLATLSALAGLALLVGGSASAFVVDRQLLADAIARATWSPRASRLPNSWRCPSRSSPGPASASS